MVKARTLFSLFIMAVVTVAATASCGNDEGTGGGTAGGGVLGDGGNSGRGGSVGRAGAAGTGTAGLSSAGSGSVIPKAVSKLATSCTTDKDCGTDLVCITTGSANFNGGGPAGGYCTLPCTGTTDPACDALEPGGASCFNLGTAAAPNWSCLLACVQGGDFDTAANKCQGRSDLTCYDVSSTATPRPFCIPMCATDKECGDGSYCDLGAGTCTKTKPTGDPVGTACTPATRDTLGNTVAGSNNCKDLCIRTSADGVMPATGVCVQFCSGLYECGYDNEQNKPTGVCYGALSDTFGLLDFGYCLPSCDCTGTCPFSDDVCRAWTSTQQSFVSDLGKNGLCVPDVAGSVELTECTGEGGAGGAGGDAGAGGTSSVAGEAGEGGSAAAH